MSLQLLQWITILWMAVELTAGAILGLRAHSIALTAFSADSGIELLSAALVLFRFRLGPHAERTTARLAATLLYLLALFIAISSIASLTSQRLHPEPTILGILLLAAAAILMPLLAAAKRRLAARTGSATLRADAAQSSLCAYMSWISLAGLALNAFIHLPWADPAAALCLLPLVLREANQTRKGDLCTCT